jgi:hypothetical protein
LISAGERIFSSDAACLNWSLSIWLWLAITILPSPWLVIVIC